jgi:hypothetical protein
VSPTVIPAGQTPTVTVTGTLFAATMPVCNEVITPPTGPVTNATCTATDVSATSATITAYSSAAGGDTITFSFGTATSTAATPAIPVQSDPAISYLKSTSVYSDDVTDVLTPTTVAIGSTGVPFTLVGTGFLAGATVTLSEGTATVTEVTPNAIFGTISLPAAATDTVGNQTATVVNTNGGSSGAITDVWHAVVAPAILSPTAGPVGGPKAILDGTATSITITGTGFVAGAVVTGAVAGVDTFGTAVVSDSTNKLDPCNGFISVTYPNGDTCNTITVPVTPVSFSGSTPILDGVVVTNPAGGGSVTAPNVITVNPVPAVTGTYYVPTFTTNAEITINGTGFETGITASSANPDYTVLAVASTPTTVTLLVTTDSNATSGTSSTITLTNPDGGSGTFPLNGGPNPNTITPAPKATAVHGLVHTGKRSTVTISGTHFYGQPKITSNAKGTVARVTKDSGKLLTVTVTTKKTTPKGVHVFIIRFANGEQTSVHYTDTK